MLVVAAVVLLDDPVEALGEKAAARPVDRSGLLASASFGISSQHGGLGVGIDFGTCRWAVIAGMHLWPEQRARWWGAGGSFYILPRPRKWAPFVMLLGGVYGDWGWYEDNVLLDEGVLHMGAVGIAVDHDVGVLNGFVMTYGGTMDLLEGAPDSYLSVIPEGSRGNLDGGVQVKVYLAVSYRFRL